MAGHPVKKGNVRAITLWRPWDQAFLYGGKRLENRPYRYPSFLHGKRIALHAGLKWDRGSAMVIEQRAGIDLLSQPDDLRRAGCVFAVARIAGMVTDSLDPWFMGPYAWVLEDFTELPVPIPCRGFQRVWRLPSDVERQVAEQLVSLRKATPSEPTEGAERQQLGLPGVS
jgi:hypothetical protein